MSVAMMPAAGAKQYTLGITKRISITICPPQAEIFGHYGCVSVPKTRSCVHFGRVFHAKTPLKSSKKFPPAAGEIPYWEGIRCFRVSDV